MNIRPATLADLETIVDFNLRLAQETEQLALDRQRVQRGVQALLSDAYKGVYFVAELDSQIVGQLMITYEWSDWRNGNFWWIQSVYVLPAQRGHGVFKRLLTHVQTRAREQTGVCGLRLYMDKHNARAREVYARLGFKQTQYEIFEMDFVLEVI